MRHLLFLTLIFSLVLCGCETDEQKKERLSAKILEKKSIKDQSEDHEFMAFLNRLRAAVAAKDMETIATMMPPDFLWRLEPDGTGDGVFAYWDKNNLWPQLNLILKEKFWPNRNVMVAPREFITKPDYKGYRAGIAVVGGGWKFVYFVNN